MSRKTGFQLVRVVRGEVDQEIQSLRSNDHEYKPGGTASAYGRPLVRWIVGEIFSVIPGVIAIAMSCLFLAYGFAVKTFEGRLIRGDSTIHTLQKAAHLVSTLQLMPDWGQK